MLKANKKPLICGNKKEAGFTIVELLIATTVFSMVLLIVSTGIIRMGQAYYKGLITAKTQETARNINEDISRAFQLAHGGKIDGPDPSKQFCVGNIRYTYFLNQKVGPGVEGLRAENIEPDEACNDANVGSNPRELLSTNMRLLHFYVGEVSGSAGRVWQVTINIGYGENGLMTHYQDDDTTPVGWDGNDVTSPAVRLATCRSGIPGGSFCATSQLDTLVKKRLN